jgi:RNA polymerase sigma-70 factor (ECF subfamily)
LPKDLHDNICKKNVFASIYTKYSRDVHNYLYYKYGEQYNPKDKAQDAFVKLWENCKNVTLGSAKAFLFKVANNMMLNEIKHKKVVLRHQKVKPKDYTNETPEFLMEKEQFLIRYQKVLENLPEEQRVAFMLNKVEGKKHSEIAKILGITRKVVEYRIYSAFNTLKRDLEGFKIK